MGGREGGRQRGKERSIYIYTYIERECKLKMCIRVRVSKIVCCKYESILCMRFIALVGTTAAVVDEVFRVWS